MCESHSRKMNEDRGNILIVYMAKISGKQILAMERNQKINNLFPVASINT